MLSFPSSARRGLRNRVEVLKQTSGDRKTDGGVGIVQAFFQKWKGRGGGFAQSFSGEESRLWLLILQKCLKDRKPLLIRRRPERLRGGCANGGIWMPRQVSGNQHRRGIA